MYRCTHCGWKGDEDDRAVERHRESSEFWGVVKSEWVAYYSCPECGEDEPEEYYPEDDDDETD